MWSVSHTVERCIHWVSRNYSRFFYHYLSGVTHRCCTTSITRYLYIIVVSFSCSSGRRSISITICICNRSTSRITIHRITEPLIGKGSITGSHYWKGHRISLTWGARCCWLSANSRISIDGYGQGYTVTFTTLWIWILCSEVIRLVVFQDGRIGQFGRSSCTLIDLDRTGNPFASDIGLQVRYLLTTTVLRIRWNSRGGRLTSDTYYQGRLFTGALACFLYGIEVWVGLIYIIIISL